MSKFKTSELFAQCAVKLQTDYTESRDRAITALSNGIETFPAKLTELETIVGLNLDGVADLKTYRRLTPDRIVSIATGQYDSLYVIASLDDCRKLREAFGPFAANESQKEIFNPEKMEVSIPLEFEIPFLCCKFSIVKVIPADAKCNIVKTTRTVEDVALVCTREE